MPRPTTICQVLHSLTVGGAEVLAARLARQLRGSYRFVFACLDELGALGEQLGGEGFRVRVLGRRPGVDWRVTLRLAQFLRHEQVDLLHAHQYAPFFYALASRLVFRRPPILFTEHGRAFPDYPRHKRIVANRLLLERRDRVVGVGQSVRQALIRNEGIPAERVAVIYNGVNLSTFANGSVDRRAVRHEMGVDAGDWVVILVARLDPLKDLATAVRTLAQVVRRRPDARLVLVGEGPERGMVEDLVRQHDLTGHVRLLGLRSDVARLLHAADVFLLTSVSEGIPVTVLEAMAAGLPVVSTQVGGVGEIIEDGRTGLLASAGDDQRLAQKILYLADQADLRRQIGCQGRERVRALFSEEQMHASYVRLYREMLDA
jgi:glycosyltransferase involved in cell wall biosynthesis